MHCTSVHLLTSSYASNLSGNLVLKSRGSARIFRVGPGTHMAGSTTSVELNCKCYLEIISTSKNLPSTTVKKNRDAYITLYIYL